MASKTALQRCCDKWRKILRLEDWDVTAEWADLENEFGTIDIDCAEREAQMLVRPDPEARRGVVTRSVELTVIHEDLHLFFPTCDPPENTPEHNEFELGLNRLAKALLASAKTPKGD